MQHTNYISHDIFIVSDVSIFLTNLSRYGGLIVEGPVCFDGNWLWKVQDTYGSTSVAQPFNDIFTSYWLFEQLGDYPFIAASNDQIPRLPAFTSAIQTLDEQESAPIISALQQLEFGYGGGPGATFLFDWEVKGCGIGTGDDLSRIQYRANQCMTIYPFTPDESVTI